MIVRRLRADEGELWRSLRMRMVADCPETYLDTVEELAARPTDLLAAYARDVAAGGARCTFVAEVSAGVIGTASAVSQDGESPEVFAVWVSPEHRRSGAGAMLMRAVERWAHEEAEQQLIELKVNDSNEAAQRFYSRLGLQLDGRSKPSKVKPGSTALYMIKRLGAPPKPADS